jgi:hypothetical protein
MKTATTILLITFALNSNAQKFYKDKTATLYAIKEKGYTCVQDQKNPNVYWYKRFDSYGQAMVQLTFENNYLRKAVIAQLNASETLDRMIDIYKTISREDALNFEHDKGVATNTQYYSGKALYQINNDPSTRDYLFLVIPLD